MKAVLDETTPEGPGGVFCVVAAAILTADEAEARHSVRTVLPPDRRRSFHWKEEGPRARFRMLEVIEELGVVAHVCVHYPTGSRRLESARAAALRSVMDQLLDDGVAELIIEARRADQNDRDRRVIFRVLTSHRGHSSFTYSWAKKEEPLLWIADAIAGSIRSYLMREDDSYFERLRTCGALSDIEYIADA